MVKFVLRSACGVSKRRGMYHIIRIMTYHDVSRPDPARITLPVTTYHNVSRVYRITMKTP